MLKSILKRILYKNKNVKKFVLKTRETKNGLVYSYYDFKNINRYMSFDRADDPYWALSSELYLEFHRLEKGLCLPPPHRFFGKDPLRETLRMLQEWQDAGFSTHNRVFTSAIEVLRAYKARLQITPPEPGEGEDLLKLLDKVLEENKDIPIEETPVVNHAAPEGAQEMLQAIMVSRHSVRNFDPTPVDFSKVKQALALAQLSPSACNRQPWHVHFYDKPEEIRKMLSLQNGNRGFGHNVPLLAVLTADMHSFASSWERIEPTLDSGIFMMSFLLGLHVVGLSSCCLNWCAPPQQDRKGHELGHIPNYHLITCYIAIGNAAAGTIVPHISRRDLEDVIVMH